MEKPAQNNHASFPQLNAQSCTASRPPHNGISSRATASQQDYWLAARDLCHFCETASYRECGRMASCCRGRALRLSQSMTEGLYGGKLSRACLRIWNVLSTQGSERIGPLLLWGPNDAPPPVPSCKPIQHHRSQMRNVCFVSIQYLAFPRDDAYFLKVRSGIPFYGWVAGAHPVSIARSKNRQPSWPSPSHFGALTNTLFSYIARRVRPGNRIQLHVVCRSPRPILAYDSYLH